MSNPTIPQNSAAAAIASALAGHRGDPRVRTGTGGQAGGEQEPAVSIELFRVLYQPSMDALPVPLICQCLNAGGEKLLWVDGVSEDSPVLIPLASTRGAKEWLGSFSEFMWRHQDACSTVVKAANGQYAPLIMVRAVEILSHDADMDPFLALEMAYQQGEQIVEHDARDQAYFERAQRYMPAA